MNTKPNNIRSHSNSTPWQATTPCPNQTPPTMHATGIHTRQELTLKIKQSHEHKTMSPPNNRTP